jgi:hypothetical protein
MCVCVYVYVCLCLCWCWCLFIYVCAGVCVCVYVFHPVADDQGNIYESDVRKAKTLFFSPRWVYRCHKPVVQLDYSQEQLLVSSHARALLIDFASKKVRQVGSKLRDGEFGCCFHPCFEDRLLAARPGKRVWVAQRSDGRVLTTMNFKSSLVALLPHNFDDPSQVCTRRKEH